MLYIKTKGLVFLKKRKNECSTTSFFKSISIGSCSGIVAWLLLLFVAALIIVKTNNPGAYIITSVFVIAAFSSFIAGLVSGKLANGKNIFPGFISGLCLLVVFFIVSLITTQKAQTSVVVRALLCTIILLFSVLGSFCAKPKRRKNISGRRRM